MIDVDVKRRRTGRGMTGAMPAPSVHPMPNAIVTKHSAGMQCQPAIEVSERDGMFNVRADFRSVPDADHVTVEFAQQGLIVSAGTVERYIPIPTDGNVELAKVEVEDRVARVSIPTAGLGHRWRAIVMW